MLKKNIKYTDYNGMERDEDFYFNFTKAELLEMELGTSNGYSEMLQQIVKENRVIELVPIFKDIILKSYGEKSLDGKRFVKNKELAEGFSQTEAFSNLYMELATDADAAAEFMQSVVPNDLRQEPELKVAKSDKNAKSN